MKPDVMIKSITTVFLILILSCQVTWATASIERTWVLHPGWNSVFLDVQPEQNDPASVFGALPPGSSVWTWINKNSSVEFISNPNEDLLKIPGWCVYFLDNEKAFLNNLHAVIAGWAYLINSPGDQEVTLNITGIASVKKTTWIPDSFNLMGFKVNPDNPPDFATFFSASPAHAGQAIYQLNNTTGKWNFIDDPASTKVKSGEAYWVYCEGASTYQGPLEIILPGISGLDYGKFNDRLSLSIQNTSDRPLTVSILPLSSEIDLTYRVWNKEIGDWEYPPLSSILPFSLVADRQKNLLIKVQRGTLEVQKAQSLIRIRDNLGTQLIVPVFVEKEIQ